MFCGPFCVAHFFSFFSTGCDQFYPGTVSQSFFIAILLAFEKRNKRRKETTKENTKRKEEKEFLAGETRRHRKFRVVEDFLSFYPHFSTFFPQKKKIFCVKQNQTLKLFSFQMREGSKQTLRMFVSRYLLKKTWQPCL